MRRSSDCVQDPKIEKSKQKFLVNSFVFATLWPVRENLSAWPKYKMEHCWSRSEKLKVEAFTGSFCALTFHIFAARPHWRNQIEHFAAYTALFRPHNDEQNRFPQSALRGHRSAKICNCWPSGERHRKSEKRQKSKNDSIFCQSNLFAWPQRKISKIWLKEANADCISIQLILFCPVPQTKYAGHWASSNRPEPPKET